MPVQSMFNLCNIHKYVLSSTVTLLPGYYLTQFGCCTTPKGVMYLIIRVMPVTQDDDSVGQ